MSVRSLLGHSGICDACGCFAHLWVGGGLPQLCDDCHLRRTVRDAYADDPDFAQRIYAAPTPEAALRQLGVSDGR